MQCFVILLISCLILTPATAFILNQQVQIPINPGRPLEIEERMTENTTELADILKCNLPLNTENLVTLQGTRYYLSYSEPMLSWHTAREFCTCHGMQLASVETKIEWDLLRPEVRKLRQVIGDWPWSSGSYVLEDKQWKWNVTGSNIDFFGNDNIINGGNNNENCLFMFNNGWGDWKCEGRLPFICEAYNTQF